MEQRSTIKRLVKKAMRGNSRAFEQLIEQFSSNILYMASQQLNDSSEAEDAAQDVVFALCRGVTRLKSPHAFYAYLKQTVYNICKEYNRKQKQRDTEDIDDFVKRQTKQLPNNLVSNDEAEKTIQLGASDVDASSQEGKMARCLQQLPQRQRQTLYLYYYQGFSYKEIAKLQGISVNTVGVNVSNAKVALRKLMEQ